MGKVLARGDDFMVVEGVHIINSTSHALKLLNKSSALLAGGARRLLGAARAGLAGWGGRWSGCSIGEAGSALYLRELCRCLGDVYDGPKHVCLVLEWGTHEMDSRHLLGAFVLEALRLLHELMPHSQMAASGGLVLLADDVRKLTHRLLKLYGYL